jgi:uroporphyrinogen decarboxylase
MPAYRALRERASFVDLVRSPELAAEATLSIIDLCDPDALIIFSDILTIPAALGAEVAYEPTVRVAPTTKTMTFPPADDWLSPAYETLRSVKRAVGDAKAIIGFAGAPFTLYTYLATATGPALRARLAAGAAEEAGTLDALARAVAMHLRRQAEAGADALQIFDTAAGELSPHLYREFALRPLCAVLEELADLACPIIVFARGRNHFDARAELPGACISVDWTIALDTIPDPGAIAVQGNLDPAVLLAGPEVTERETERMLRSAAALGGHIANLGHGVLPATPVESVQAFVSTAKLYRVTRAEA